MNSRIQYLSGRYCQLLERQSASQIGAAVERRGSRESAVTPPGWWVTLARFAGYCEGNGRGTGGISTLSTSQNRPDDLWRPDRINIHLFKNQSVSSSHHLRKASRKASEKRDQRHSWLHDRRRCIQADAISQRERTASFTAAWEVGSFGCFEEFASFVSVLAKIAAIRSPSSKLMTMGS